jgi:hypothetical protein
MEIQKDMIRLLALILFLGFLLFIFQKPISEGFTNPQRCDLDNPCEGHLKCINGFCAKTDPVHVREENPVPLLPPGGPAPYF